MYTEAISSERDSRIEPDASSGKQIFEIKSSSSVGEATRSLRISHTYTSIVSDILGEPLKKYENLKTLRSFKNLPNNWDSEGAGPFDDALVDRCIELINSPNLRYQPKIYPTGRNSIQFEYEKLEGEYLEIEIFLDHIDFYYEDSSGEDREEDDVDWESILTEIENFHA